MSKDTMAVEDFKEWAENKIILSAVSANENKDRIALLFDEVHPEFIEIYAQSDKESVILPIPAECLVQGLIAYMRVTNKHYETNSTVH